MKHVCATPHMVELHRWKQQGHYRSGEIVGYDPSSDLHQVCWRFVPTGTLASPLLVLMRNLHLF